MGQLRILKFIVFFSSKKTQYIMMALLLDN